MIHGSFRSFPERSAMNRFFSAIFFLLSAPASFALPGAVTLHQSMLFPKLESAYSHYCNIASLSRSTECFSKSILLSSSRPLSKAGLEKVLNHELLGTVHLNRNGFRKVDFKTGIAALLKKHPSQNMRESLIAAKEEVLSSVGQDASSWIDGILWTGL
ncbi:MAG: hypothetical protein EBX52_12195, partial [Proteobacteria bacterium]|nr:hypothetical protein [Pseudomonadota bacterium]